MVWANWNDQICTKTQKPDISTAKKPVSQQILVGFVGPLCRRECCGTACGGAGFGSRSEDANFVNPAQVAVTGQNTSTGPRMGVRNLVVKDREPGDTGSEKTRDDRRSEE